MQDIKNIHHTDYRTPQKNSRKVSYRNILEIQRTVKTSLKSQVSMLFILYKKSIERKYLVLRNYKTLQKYLTSLPVNSLFFLENMS